MTEFFNKFSDFVLCDDGVTALEYGLIAALIAVAVIAVIATIGSKLSDAFQSICTKINNGTAC